jgi:hypothetical protein
VRSPFIQAVHLSIILLRALLTDGIPFVTDDDVGDMFFLPKGSHALRGASLGLFARGHTPLAPFGAALLGDGWTAGGSEISFLMLVFVHLSVLVRELASGSVIVNLIVTDWDIIIDYQCGHGSIDNDRESGFVTSWLKLLNAFGSVKKHVLKSMRWDAELPVTCLQCQ